MELLLITTHFPYNENDAVFIKPEIPFLSNAFDRIHILYTDKNATQFKKIEVPKNVYIISHKESNLSLKGNKFTRFFNTFFCSFFSPFYIVSICIFEYLYLFRQNKLNKNTAKIAIKYILMANLDACFLKKYLSQNSDIKIIYTFWYERNTFSALICKKYFIKNIKCVTRTHGIDLYEHQNENNYLPYKTWMDKSIDRIFFVSKAGYDYYNNLFANQQTREKYIVLKLGIENQYNFILKDDYIRKKLNVISCSYIIPRKRINLIIEALSNIIDISINWVHIGDGPEKNYIEKLAEQLLDNKSNIKYNFIGHLNNDSIKDFYHNNHFDCFISTTAAEGGNPVSMMEAISFGIPIIATNTGGVPEVVQKENGILINSDNPVTELADALQHFAAMTNQEMMSIRKNCREYWENNYRAETQYPLFVAELKKLL